jgi:hypothetical protein
MYDASPAAAAPPPDDDVRVVAGTPVEAPISILAVLAFFSSFIAGGLSFMLGWNVVLIPIALAGLALMLMRSNGKRGRILAIFGLLVATGFGSCAWLAHYKGSDELTAVPRGLLGILADKSTTVEAKDAALATWMWPKALEDNPALAASWRARFAKIESEFGAWSGEVAHGDHQVGFNAIFMPPPHGEEIQPPAGAPAASALAPGGAVWVKAPFAKGPIWVCAVLVTGDDDFREEHFRAYKDGVHAVAGAIRYFRP